MARTRKYQRRLGMCKQRQRILHRLYGIQRYLRKVGRTIKQIDKLKRQTKQEFIDMIMHSIEHIDCGACPAEKFCQEQYQHGYTATNNSCRDIVGAWLESEVDE